MTDSGFRPTVAGTSNAPAEAASGNASDALNFASLEPRDQLLELLRERAAGRPFSELAAVTFDHRGATVMGHLLLDALEDAGYSVDDFDAVGALTAAAVPLVISVVQAAASRGEDVDGFVMDFVYPSIKGPSIKGKRVVLLDAWLSEKSYVQTSSLVTLRNGNELSLDVLGNAADFADGCALRKLLCFFAANEYAAGKLSKRRKSSLQKPQQRCLAAA